MDQASSTTTLEATNDHFFSFQFREEIGDWTIRGFNRRAESSKDRNTILCGEGGGIWTRQMVNESEGDTILT